MIRTSFFLYDQFLGDMAVANTLAGAPWSYNSRVYICPVCGEVWGRVVCDRDTLPHLRWTSLDHTCPAHPDYWRAAGTFLPGNDLINLAALPPAVIQHEFQMHLADYERKYGNC